MHSSSSNSAALIIDVLFPKGNTQPDPTLWPRFKKRPSNTVEREKSTEGGYFRDAGDRARQRRLILCGERLTPHHNRSLIINDRIVAFSRSHGE
jgi:hypothetical protein